MSLENFIFTVICFVCFGLWMGFLFLIKGITFYGPACDDVKQVNAASSASTWKWPSDMHKASGGKSRMKDAVVLGLVFMQKIFRDKKSDYPLVALCGLTNCLSAVLLYAIAAKWWGLSASVVVFGLYAFSMWPWQAAIMSGHICVSQMFFLFSIFCLVMAGSTSAWCVFWWYAAAGAAFVFTQFSSASSRKYSVLFLAGLWYSQSVIFFRPFYQINTVSKRSLYISIVSVAACIIFVVIRVLLKDRLAASLAKKMYKNESQGPYKDYFTKVGRAVDMAFLIFIVVFLNTAIYMIFFSWSSFVVSQIWILAGSLSAGIVLLMPNFYSNAAGYWSYFCGSQFNRFCLYKDYFAHKGIVIAGNFRGAGFIWLLRYFFRVEPVLFFYYLLAVVFLFWVNFARGELTGGISAVLFILLSASPVLWGEITKGAQIGRSYFPFIPGQLVAIAVVVACVESMFNPAHNMIFVWLLTLAVLVNAAWSFWIFFTDVYPARMAPAWLEKTLRQNGIKKIYTYNTVYNNDFVNTLNNKSDLEIVYVNAIEDIKEKKYFLAVPCTSSKSLSMESGEEGYANKDFRSDPRLNELLDSGRIKDHALAQFKTFGNSRILSNESEVLSFRDLILKEICPVDRWRSYAWLLSIDDAVGKNK